MLNCALIVVLMHIFFFFMFFSLFAFHLQVDVVGPLLLNASLLTTDCLFIVFLLKFLTMLIFLLQFFNALILIYGPNFHALVVRSTSESRPNNIEGRNVRPYVRPPTKSFFNLNEIWYIGRGR